MHPPINSSYLTRQEAAELICCHEITIDRLIRDGKLPAIKLSKRFVRIKRSDLDKVLEKATLGRIKDGDARSDNTLLGDSSEGGRDASSSLSKFPEDNRSARTMKGGE